jgi:hypothetical protein
MCRPSIKFQAGRRYAVVQRARYRPQDMGQYEIATVQTTAATAYVNTCECIAIDIYSCPALRTQGLMPGLSAWNSK